MSNIQAKPDPRKARFKLKIWFLSPPSKVRDNKPRTFYSYDKPGNESEGFMALVNLAEKVRIKGELRMAEIYVNNPSDESKEVRLLHLKQDGTRV